MKNTKERRSWKALVDALAFLFLIGIVVFVLGWMLLRWTDFTITLLAMVGFFGALYWLLDREGEWFR